MERAACDGSPFLWGYFKQIHTPIFSSFAAAMPQNPDCFIPFSSAVDQIKLPEQFTFPFYYQPHELSKRAAQSLQQKLEALDLDHNFGLEPNKKGLVIGKMFGVLVVQNAQGEMGYLAAFSGKLANENHHIGFVPPVFDMLQKDGFFKAEETHLNALNAQIETLENAADLSMSLAYFTALKQQAETELANHRTLIKQGKAERKAIRVESRDKLSEEAFQRLEAELVKQSLDQQYQYKRLAKHWRETLESAEAKYLTISNEIARLKEERRTRSGALQNRLFEQYQFLNAKGDWKSLLDIFSNTDQQTPPAGAGECAAPKLLHYAFKHDLKPVAMAEFWWGASPKSEVRKHRQFYPACRGKCEPILGHMLQGLDVEPNPMLENPAEGKELEIVFEDEYMLAVNKPAEFLSVPGKTISDSVYSRLKLKYPDATGPLIVHRLDMSTSGLLLIAKTKEAHQRLQYQFLKRTVKKRYVALLEGELLASDGEIDLPLRVDLDNRPCQLVCYEHGKAAKTRWERISTSNGKTLVYFYPITGRTHQLRVHAAHQLGLNTPIVGDDLYGNLADRLHLHAEQIQFKHPITKEEMVISAPVPFSI
jgi:tRNA pseudouridine32 synthase / 23S rRNA pseudouridine746 synthase